VTNRDLFILCLGGALVGIGLVALNFPTPDGAQTSAAMYAVRRFRFRAR
jgi:hypothetical protein